MAFFTYSPAHAACAHGEHDTFDEAERCRDSRLAAGIDDVRICELVPRASGGFVSRAVIDARYLAMEQPDYGWHQEGPTTITALLCPSYGRYYVALSEDRTQAALWRVGDHRALVWPIERVAQIREAIERNERAEDRRAQRWEN